MLELFLFYQVILYLITNSSYIKPFFWAFFPIFIKQTIYNLKLTSIEANRTMKSINKIVDSINFNKSIAGLILNDSIEAERVRGIITNLDESSNDIKMVLR